MKEDIFFITADRAAIDEKKCFKKNFFVEKQQENVDLLIENFHNWFNRFEDRDEDIQ